MTKLEAAARDAYPRSSDDGYSMTRPALRRRAFQSGAKWLAALVGEEEK